MAARPGVSAFVDDLIEAMIRMMNNESGFIGPMNIGNPTEFTMLELASTIISLSGSESKLIYATAQRRSEAAAAGHFGCSPSTWMVPEGQYRGRARNND
jgi:nucleoside-diphosphate-sugar epimerase